MALKQKQCPDCDARFTAPTAKEAGEQWGNHWLNDHCKKPAPASSHQEPHAKNDMCIGCCERWHREWEQDE